MSGKSILVHLSSAPFGTSNAKEALDLVLAAGTFDQDISFLLSDDACYLLLENQNPDSIQQKNIRQMMKALGIYGVETVYVSKEDAIARSIPVDQCSLNLSLLTKQEARDKTRQAEIVIRF
jgi:tRNA 2-thiouridine synthesizing protein C